MILYLKLAGKEKWPMTIAVSFFTWLFIYGLFERALSIPFPEGLLVYAVQIELCYFCLQRVPNPLWSQRQIIQPHTGRPIDGIADRRRDGQSPPSPVPLDPKGPGPF